MMALLVSASPVGASEQPPPPLPLGRADLGREVVVVSSSGDLWITGPDGGMARQLTSGPAWDDLPILSPDETTLAFARSYDGEKDLYVMPMQGGEPMRLTWHPKEDFPRDWSADGREILFSSSREGDALDRLYVIAATGGTERALDLPSGSMASWAPDGQRLALTPGPKFGGWLRYRGGNVPRIQVVDLASGQIEVIPHRTFADWQPMWVGDDIWFLSERNGVSNLYRWRSGQPDAVAMTHFDTYGIESASAGPGAILLVVQGRLWRFDINRDALRPIDITLPEEGRPDLSVRTEPVADFADEYLLTPDGGEILVVARGDLFAVDRHTGGARNLTDTPGIADRRPAVSPNGELLAWFSDESGEYRLQVARLPADGIPARPASVITIGAAPTFYSQPTWSPDSRHLVVSDVHRRLWLVDVEARRAEELDRSDYPANDDFQPAFSPDGTRVAWVKHLPSRIRGVFVREVSGTSVPRLVTPPLASCESPVFSADGTSIHVTMATLGPAADTFGMSSRLFRTMLSRSLLSVRVDNPTGMPPTTIPVESRNYVALGRSADGQLLAVVETPGGNPMAGRPTRSIHRIDPGTGESRVLVESMEGWEFSADGGSVLVVTRQGIMIGATDTTSLHPVMLDSLTARVGRRAEWRQIYHECWRLMRDYFYDPAHHGQDLVALERNYAGFLPGLRTRRDLNDLITMMFGHISVSHLDVGGGDERPISVPDGFRPPPPVGLPGVDVEIVGDRFRLTRVLVGDSRSPSTTGPIADAGIAAQPGEWLLAVNGKAIHASRNFHSWFEMSGRGPVQLTLGPDSSGTGARTGAVRLLRGENTLRRVDWAESNRRLVLERSGGRVGYLYLPDTGARGFENFHQMLYAQRDMDGLVIDERFNSGGAPADLFVETLARRPLSAYTFRAGQDVPFPSGVFEGPMVMITNQSSGSGGDTLPWMFRRAGLGTLVGTRTMGAGIGGYIEIPTLIDGGDLGIPTRGFYNPDGTWDIENGGVSPDMPVEITPIDWRAGRDTQMERAVDEVLSKMGGKAMTRKSPRGTPPPG